MKEPLFLTQDEILFNHHQEIQISGSELNVRDEDGVLVSTEVKLNQLVNLENRILLIN